MKLPLRAAALAVGLLAVAGTLPLNGAPGDLDLSFGNGGKVITAVGTGDDRGNSVVVLSDGKIVVAGVADSGSSYDFALVRYAADGSLDPEFGNGGKVVTSIGNTGDYGERVAVQADGKLLVAGNGTGYDFALARYNTDGSLDAAFGNGGKVTTFFGGGYAGKGQSLVVQTDGKIVVSGYVYYVAGSGGYNFALARYNNDGTLDTDFGDGGKLVTPFGGGIGGSVALQSDGKIVVAGSTTSGTISSFAVARYNADGSLDTDFGNNGKRTISFGADGGSYAQDVLVQPDGKILVVGVSYSNNTGSISLVRLTATGELDFPFGNGSKVTTSFGIGNAGHGQSLALQSDGKIVVTGHSDVGNKDLALVRYNVDGSLDETFGTGGKVITAVGSAYDDGRSVAVQPDGRIVVAGVSWNGKNQDIVVVRYEGGPFLPTVTTNVVSEVTSTSATLNGTVIANNADSAVTFDYGLTEDYGTAVVATPQNVTGLAATQVNAAVAGLLPHTTYHYRVAARNSLGISKGLDGTFTTLNTVPVTNPDAGFFDGSPMVTVDVLANDSDVDGDALTIESFTQGSRGSVAQSGSTLIYTPGSDFYGVDVFSYTVSDGFGGSSTASVEIKTFIPITQIVTKGAVGGKSKRPGDDVPGEATGTTFKTFGVPAVNSQGHVAFQTSIATPDGNLSAVFDGSSVVARTGQPTPGEGELAFKNFTDPALNANGAVAFFSGVQAPGKTAKIKGLYTTVGGTLTQVIRTGAEIPGMSGAKLGSLSTFQLLEGAVLFHGKLKGAPANADMVLCSWTPADGVKVLLREGADVGGKKSKSFSTLVPAATSTGHGRNATNQVSALVRVTFKDGTQALAEIDSDEARIIAQTSEDVPAEPSGAQWKSFGLPAVNSAGHAAFLGTLAVGPGDVTASDNKGLFAEFEGLPLTLIARQGQFFGDSPLNGFSDPVHNIGSDVAALVGLRGKGGTRGKAILYAGKSAAPQLLARTGDEAPGVPGAKWKSFKTLALPDSLGPVFIGMLKVRSGGVNKSDDMGLWALDSLGELRLIVRERQRMQVGGETKTLKKFTVLSLVPGSPDQTRAFNTLGQMVYQATFTDGSQAIVRVQIP